MDPKRNHRPVMCAIAFLALIAAAAGAAFTGCGTTGDATRPSMTTPYDDGGGEVAIPIPNHLLPTPEAVKAQFVGAGTILVTWNSRQMPYETVIAREGVEIGRVNALAEQYADHVSPKAPRSVTYAVRFASGLRLSPEVVLHVVIPDNPSAGPRPSPVGDVGGADSGN